LDHDKERPKANKGPRPEGYEAMCRVEKLLTAILKAGGILTVSQLNEAASIVSVLQNRQWESVKCYQKTERSVTEITSV
jgi:hypothetical protein